MKKILELFAWARSIWKAAESLWHKVFSVDWEKYEDIDLSIDIEHLTMKDIPFIPDHIHASFDCTTYSLMAISKHRNKDNSPKSEYAEKCDRVNKKVIELIKVYQKINPKLTYSFENPRAKLRKMDFMQEFNRHTVWYCQYWYDIPKPTDIWTNLDWTPRPECRNHKYDKEGNIIDRHCHHQSARRWAKTWTQWKKNSYERSKIPEQLCIELMSCV